MSAFDFLKWAIESRPTATFVGGVFVLVAWIALCDAVGKVRNG